MANNLLTQIYNTCDLTNSSNPKTKKKNNNTENKDQKSYLLLQHIYYPSRMSMNTTLN